MTNNFYYEPEIELEIERIHIDIIVQLRESVQFSIRRIIYDQLNDWIYHRMVTNRAISTSIANKKY